MRQLHLTRHTPPRRSDQDAFAAASHKKAAAAARAGKFKDEIVPVHTKVTDPKTKETRPIVVDADDGIRGGSTAEGLSKLKPAFKADGSTTAGNSSQVRCRHAVPARVPLWCANVARYALAAWVLW